MVEREKERAFAEDTRWIGNYLFELALPLELKKLTAAASNFSGQSPLLVKHQLQEMFDFKKQQAFLDILKDTLCQVPMAMAELNSALSKLPGDKIPMLRERKQAECRGDKIGYHTVLHQQRSADLWNRHGESVWYVDLATAPIVSSPQRVLTVSFGRARKTAPGDDI